MRKANEDIRRELRDAHIPLWRLGIVQGCNEVTMVRRLRLELSDQDKDLIRNQIKQIVQEDMEG